VLGEGPSRGRDAGSDAKPGGRALRTYACGEPFNYPQVSTVKDPENFEKLIYNRFNLL